jgi:hypothetical protein
MLAGLVQDREIYPDLIVMLLWKGMLDLKPNKVNNLLAC